jgi:hypothetical protein
VVASHNRSYGREEEVLDPHHYLAVLLKKPGAFPSRLLKNSFLRTLKNRCLQA